MEAVKGLHVLCALLSISGFAGRGILMLKGSALLSARWLKIAPHIVDTLLLLSALVLAGQWGVAALDLPLQGSRVIEIGGPDQVSYREIRDHDRGFFTELFFIKKPA